MEPSNQKSQIAQEYGLLPADARQQILYMETTRLRVGAFLKTFASVLWKLFCRTNYFGLLYGTF